MDSVETWKPVVGFEGRYDASDHGRIRRSFDAPTANNTLPGQVRSPWLDAAGYPSVCLTIGKRFRISTNVHTLIMQSFVGPRPDGHHVDHIDRNKGNNKLCNLRYWPISDNTSSPGEANAQAKLTEDGVRMIHLRITQGFSCTRIGAEFRVSRSLISLIGRGKIWGHLGLGIAKRPRVMRLCKICHSETNRLRHGRCDKCRRFFDAHRFDKRHPGEDLRKSGGLRWPKKLDGGHVTA